MKKKFLHMANFSPQGIACGNRDKYQVCECVFWKIKKCQRMYSIHVYYTAHLIVLLYFNKNMFISPSFGKTTESQNTLVIGLLDDRGGQEGDFDKLTIAPIGALYAMVC